MARAPRAWKTSPNRQYELIMASASCEFVDAITAACKPEAALHVSPISNGASFDHMSQEASLALPTLLKKPSRNGEPEYVEQRSQHATLKVKPTKAGPHPTCTSALGSAANSTRLGDKVPSGVLLGHTSKHFLTIFQNMNSDTKLTG